MSEFKPYDVRGNRIYPITINKSKEITIAFIATVVAALTENKHISTNPIYTDYISIRGDGWEPYMKKVFEYARDVEMNERWDYTYGEMAEKIVTDMKVEMTKEMADAVSYAVYHYSNLQDCKDNDVYSTQPYK